MSACLPTTETMSVLVAEEEEVALIRDPVSHEMMAMSAVKAYDGGGGGYRDNVGYTGAYDDGDYVDHVNMSFDAGAVINQRVMYVLDSGCSVS